MVYRRADRVALERIWQKSLDRNPGDARWVAWREEYLRINRDGWGVTYLILDGDEPVGEGTLLFDPACSAIAGRTILADGRLRVNLNALRIEKAYEGQGHISRLVRMMEQDARRMGYDTITIGVDEIEHRNRAIYAHWGYDALILRETEGADVVLYYEKKL